MSATRYARYSYLRALEIEGRHPEDAGIWQVTAMRMGAGEGEPFPGSVESLVEHPEGAPLPPVPKLPPSMLRASRPVYYRRLRSTTECERYLALVLASVGVSLRLFASWADPPAGVIPIPEPEEQALPLTHLVSLTDWSHELRTFTFENWWGEKWGDGGKGYLPYAYFDRYAFECWVGYYGGVNYHRRKEQAVRDRREVSWTVRDESDHRVYGFEICHETREDRLAWAFVVERDGALEVEELYVRPEFRGRGHGRRLTERVAELARAKSQAVRLWVPFADSRPEDDDNYPALIAVARRLGLAFRPCPVSWAAYLATNEPATDSSPEPIEPASIPQRPRSASSMIKAAVLAASMAVNGASSEPSAVQPVAAARADSPAIGTEAWGQMNRRRAELIRKKNRQGLTSEERDEYERLQSLSRSALEDAFPGPPASDERLDRLEARLRAAPEE